MLGLDDAKGDSERSLSCVSVIGWQPTRFVAAISLTNMNILPPHRSGITAQSMALLCPQQGPTIQQRQDSSPNMLFDLLRSVLLWVVVEKLWRVRYMYSRPGGHLEAQKKGKGKKAIRKGDVMVCTKTSLNLVFSHCCSR